MFEDASLQVLSSRRVPIPFGNYCDSYKAADGTSLSEYEAFGIKSAVQILNTMLVVTMKNGGFEIGDGNHISSKEERQGLMKDIVHFAKEGFLTFISEWVVQRPSES